MRSLYVQFEQNGVRGIAAAEFEAHLVFFTREFASWLSAQPAKIHLDRPNWVASVILPAEIAGGSSVLQTVVKRFGRRSPLERLPGAWIGSKALRSFRIAVHLREAGVSTPRPLIAFESAESHRPSAGYYITEDISDSITLREHLRNRPPGRDPGPLLERLSSLVRGLHDAGVFHRDLTIGNFLVRPEHEDSDGPWLIDLSRALQLKRMPIWIRLMDLARIKLPGQEAAFFKAYCKGRPEWLRWAPLLRVLIGWRRRRMDLWKAIKGR